MEEYLVPGYRSPEKGEPAYNNYTYPSVDKKLILKILDDVASDFPPLSSVNAEELLRNNVVLYGMGLMTGTEVLESIKHVFPNVPARMEKEVNRLTRIILAAIRVGAKYDMPRLIHDVIRHKLFMSSIEGLHLSADDREIFDVAVHEIDQLMAHDNKALPDVLAELNNVDLGNMETLKELDPAMLGMADKILKGGIDLNSALVDVGIKRQGYGIRLSRFSWAFQKVNVDGFVPIIITIAPMADFESSFGPL